MTMTSPTQRAGADVRRSTHHVHRGAESIPCYCALTMDHAIGREASDEALALAIRFHETYERLAPSFGYETRTETRAFDPTTPNGRLMIAVCDEVTAALQARIAELETEAEERENELSDARETCAAEYERDAARALRSVMALIPKDDSDEPLTAHQQFDAIAERIAELEAGIQRRDDDVIVPLALYDEINRVGYEWQQRAEAAEARNAASERDAGRYRWLRDMPSLAAERSVGAIAHEGPCILQRESLDRAIDAHAQGRAGEEKDERG